MNLKPYLWLVCLPSLMQTPQALASNINIHGDIDLSTIGIGKFNDAPFLQNAVGSGITFWPSVSISKGDTVSVEIGFLNGQYLNMSSTGNTQEFNGWLSQDINIDYPNTSYFEIHSITNMNFYNDSTNVLSLLPKIDSSGAAHIGPSYSGNFIGTGNTITFNRYTFSFIVDNLTIDGTDAVDNHHYDSPYMRFAADNVAITLAQVPLPNSVLLMFSGILFLLGKRHRKSA